MQLHLIIGNKYSPSIGHAQGVNSPVRKDLENIINPKILGILEEIKGCYETPAWKEFTTMDIFQALPGCAAVLLEQDWEKLDVKLRPAFARMFLGYLMANNTWMLNELVDAIEEHKRIRNHEEIPPLVLLSFTVQLSEFDLHEGTDQEMRYNTSVKGVSYELVKPNPSPRTRTTYEIAEVDMLALGVDEEVS